MARDFVRHVQQLRKDLDLEIQDRISVHYSSEESEVGVAIAEWDEFVRGETLADSIERSSAETEGVKPVSVGECRARIWIGKSAN